MVSPIVIPAHGWMPRRYQMPLWNYLNSGGDRACLVWHRRCFAAGTMVMMAGGVQKPIEDVRVGDMVVALGADGYMTETPVTGTFPPIVRPCARYRVGEIAVTCTPDHRFCMWNPQSKAGKYISWVPIKDIAARGKGSFVGTHCYSLDGTNDNYAMDLIVAEVWEEASVGPQKVYDLEVAGAGSFFANGLLVHNSGKDEMCLQWAAVAAHKRVGSYWHMLPEAAQARKAIWDAVNPKTRRRRIDDAFPPEIRESTRENEMFIRFLNGSTWQVVGSDNYESLVGSPPVGVVFSEWAIANPAAWAYIRPILAENGGWAMFIGTPRGPNHFQKLFLRAQASEEWFAQLLTAEDTGVLDKDTLDRELAEMIDTYGEEEGRALFEQEYYCSFSGSFAGSIYGSFLRDAEREGRIGVVRPAPSYPVCSSWDLGMKDDTAIWLFQECGGHTRFLKTIHNRMQPLEYYVNEIKDFCAKNCLVYGYSIVPHDAEPPESGTGMSRREMLDSMGMNCIRAPMLSKQDGINAARALIRTSYFDALGCEDGLRALKMYHRKKNEALNTWYSEPVHDESSHYADAFRYRAVTPVQEVGGRALGYGVRRAHAIDRPSNIWV